MPKFETVLTQIEIASGSGDEDISTNSEFLYGICVTDSGTLGDGRVFIRQDSGDNTGDKIVDLHVPSGTTKVVEFPAPVSCPNGIRLDRDSGTQTVVVWVEK